MNIIIISAAKPQPQAAPPQIQQEDSQPPTDAAEDEHPSIGNEAIAAQESATDHQPSSTLATVKSDLSGDATVSTSTPNQG